MRRPDDLEATDLDEVLERAPCNRQLEYTTSGYTVPGVVISDW